MSENGNNDDIHTSTTESQGNNTQITKIEAERARKKKQHELDIAEFAKYYFARIPKEQICQKILKISESTYYRYVQELSDQHKHMLHTLHRESLTLEIATYQHDLDYLINRCKMTIENKDQRFTEDEVLSAMNMMAEFGKQKLLLYTNGPIDMLQHIPFIYKKEIDEKNTIEIKVEEAGSEDNGLSEGSSEKTETKTS